MPRPKRDYGAALRLDIDKLDAQIRGLVVRRSKLVRMLHDYESTKDNDINVDAALREVLTTPRPAPTKTAAARRGRR